MPTYRIVGRDGGEMAVTVRRSSQDAVAYAKRTFGPEGDFAVTEVHENEIVFATEDGIKALREDAGVAGDIGMAALCDRALHHDDEAARIECEAVLRARRAMED